MTHPPSFIPAARIFKATAEHAGELFRLIRALAEYERLDPPDDAATQRLHRDLFGPAPRLEAWLADVDGHAAGYALVLETYSSFLALPTLYLEDIFVAPEYRGSRVGATLFFAMSTLARDRGCGRMDWTVLDWNTPALDFYDKVGAARLDEWRLCRLDARALAALPAVAADARPSSPPPPSFSSAGTTYDRS